MSTWTAEELFIGLERWFKARRDQYRGPNDPGGRTVSWDVINRLLDELRDNGVEGFFPWQRIPKSGMPEFTIKAQDPLAVLAVEAYEDLCIESGWHDQADEVRKAKNEIELWQENNPDRVRDRPRHPHVPVTDG